jgi:hypothetical protein
MPSVAVHYIELSKKTNDLVLATHGEELSFWMILVLVSNKSVLNKDLHFFDLKAAVIEEQSNLGHCN